MTTLETLLERRIDKAYKLLQKYYPHVSAYAGVYTGSVYKASRLNDHKWLFYTLLIKILG